MRREEGRVLTLTSPLRGGRRAKPAGWGCCGSAGRKRGAKPPDPAKGSIKTTTANIEYIEWWACNEYAQHILTLVRLGEPLVSVVDTDPAAPKRLGFAEHRFPDGGGSYSVDAIALITFAILFASWIVKSNGNPCTCTVRSARIGMGRIDTEVGGALTKD